MTGPLLTLRAAILGALTDDDALAATMGGDVKLYDEPPAGSTPVYAVFGPAEARDDSVDGARRCNFPEKFPHSRKNLSRFSDKLVCRANSILSGA